MSPISSSNIISTILRHDKKITSYKITLLRTINDKGFSLAMTMQQTDVCFTPWNYENHKALWRGLLDLECRKFTLEGICSEPLGES